MYVCVFPSSASEINYISKQHAHPGMEGGRKWSEAIFPSFSPSYLSLPRLGQQPEIERTIPPPSFPSCTHISISSYLNTWRKTLGRSGRGRKCILVQKKCCQISFSSQPRFLGSKDVFWFTLMPPILSSME